MTESPDAEDFQAEIIRRYDAPMYRAMLEVYGDQIHPGFLEEDDHDIRAAALRATARLAELANIAPGANVLETACGVGGTARYLAAKRGARVVATNIARSQLAIAAEWTRNAEGADRIRYEFADYHALPFADSSFDVYWCQDSLLFSTDKPRALAEAARVLRPGGTIAISDLVVTGTPAPVQPASATPIGIAATTTPAAGQAATDTPSAATPAPAVSRRRSTSSRAFSSVAARVSAASRSRAMRARSSCMMASSSSMSALARSFSIRAAAVRSSCSRATEKRASAAS